MIYVINNLKFDTDVMELISDKVRTVEFIIEGRFSFPAKIYKSRKGRYVLINNFSKAEIISEKEVRNMLFEHDVRTYEKLFGELEEG